MINLKNEQIKHKSWGLGDVVEQTDTYIKIEFSVGIKQFQYPEAFEKFLKCSDTQLQEKILSDLADKKQQESEKKIKLQEERRKTVKTYEHAAKAVSGKKKTHPKENIAFKCNFCNGGSNENGIPFRASRISNASHGRASSSSAR